MDQKYEKYYNLLTKLGGNYQASRRCIDGHMELWIFPKPIDEEKIFLELDKLNSDFSKIEVTKENGPCNSNLKIYYQHSSGLT